MNDELKNCFYFIVHRSDFILSFEPVAQKDQSAGLRRLRPHVRVVPGSLSFRGRLKGGRLPLEQVMEVRVLPPESFTVLLGWRNGKRTALRSPGA